MAEVNKVYNNKNLNLSIGNNGYQEESFINYTVPTNKSLYVPNIGIYVQNLDMYDSASPNYHTYFGVYITAKDNTLNTSSTFFKDRIIKQGSGDDRLVTRSNLNYVREVNKYALWDELEVGLYIKTEDYDSNMKVDLYGDVAMEVEFRELP